MLASLFAGPAFARVEAPSSPSPVRDVPALSPAVPRSSYGSLAQVWLVPDVGPAQPLELKGVTLGERFTPALARRAMRELLDSGAYASVSASTQLEANGGVVLRLLVVERKVVAETQVNGGLLDLEQTLSTASITVGQEITRPGLKRAAARVWQLYKEHGFPEASVSGSWLETGEPRRVKVVLTVAPGPPRQLTEVSLVTPSNATAEVRALASQYSVKVGERADTVRLQGADENLQARYRSAGYFRASVHHWLSPEPENRARVLIESGPHYQIRFEGLRAFDATSLRSALEIDPDTVTFAAIQSQIVDYYERHGYLDAAVTFNSVVSADHSREDWVFFVHEGQRLRVASRVYPCLAGPRDASELDAEIEGILSEHLPGGDDIVAPVDPGRIDSALAGDPSPNGVEVPKLEPWSVYSPAEYDRALTHLRDLYRSEGYLSAVVGPATLLRRQCESTTGPSRCVPVGQRVVPPSLCPSAEQPIPAEEEPAQTKVTCRPDRKKGIRCEPAAMLSVPVKLGPRTVLWDVEFRGNRLLVDTELLRVAQLQLGQPLSQLELQRARRRLAEAYGDRGFAYAAVEVELELSQDRTRGKARFVISEREPVTIRSFVVRGARQTRESLILGRLALRPGGLYRHDLVRDSEEQLASLGVFSSVTVELEDPDVPAREKVVIVSVQERPSQYVDVKPGFSTGEGFRIGLEYGHRNLFGRALQLRFRFQLGYLPGALIIEGDVRRRFDALTFYERLERRNSVTLELPLPARFRVALDGVDVRDNSRDFGITKRAAIVTITHRPQNNVSLVTGASLEDNDVTVFKDKTNLQQYLEQNPQYVRLLNVPDGRSFAVAFRLGGAWDGTDNPLGATRGMFISLDTEPVVAFLDKNSSAVNLAQCEQADSDPNECEYRSRFLKLTTRVAGYIPFNNKGLSLALSLRTGANVQLVQHSVTYPDRLFFLGGSDSLRGFAQDSVIPQDLADRVQSSGSGSPADALAASQILVRGGDVIINPRAELRIPLTKMLQTAVFVDAGNVWRELNNFQPWVLRYAAGSGLRVTTPIGPLAFDYGIPLDPRPYEDSFGAFHFSVGLF